MRRLAERAVNVELLIHAIVRQTTILIAQLATAHGIRAPLPHIADQVFRDLVDELDRQGVSRKVSADMFGMGLRTYRRKVQRLRESSTLRGRSLWESIFAFIKEQGSAERAAVVEQFCRDDEEQIKAVLHDLTESGLVVATGAGARASYRATTAEETLGPVSASSEDVDDDLLVALMYREGPLGLAQIADMAHEAPAKTEVRLARLVNDGKVKLVEGTEEKRYQAEALLIPLGAGGGWEGAVFDHYKALVATILSRLQGKQPTTPADSVGGSTYTLEVWPGHPQEAEVLGTLQRVRGELSGLRSRLVATSETLERPPIRKRVTIYLGQAVVEEEDENGN